MDLYRRRLLPCAVKVAMHQPALLRLREQLVGAASGRVVEIGIGSGSNLPLYRRDVSEVIGFDRSGLLLERARRQAAWVHFPVKLRETDASSLPLDDRSVDCAVMTWTLCSLADPLGALGEVRRILRKDGMLLFADHGLGMDPRIQRWQDRLTPIWRQVSSNCHLNRRIDRLVTAGGLKLASVQTGYLPGLPRVAAFHYSGRATPF